jgi:hypothetical protein
MDVRDKTGKSRQDGDVMVKASDEKVLSVSFCLPEGFD